MATIAKQFLSGASDGLMVQVAATATPGTTIHTAHATDKDEIWLYAVNTDSATKNLTIEWGGTTTACLIEVGIPGESGLILVVPGWVLSNSKVVAAFCNTTNVVSVGGWVNRIT